jgi:hypothetical protein
MSKEDWIILRLILVGARNRKTDHDTMELTQTIVYMHKKLGGQAFADGLTLLESQTPKES